MCWGIFVCCCNVQSFPHTVGNQPPYESDACKFPINNSFAFFLFDGFYNLAGNLIHGHEQWVVLVGGQKSRIYKTGLYVGDGNVAVLHV